VLIGISVLRSALRIDRVIHLIEGDPPEQIDVRFVVTVVGAELRLPRRVFHLGMLGHELRVLAHGVRCV
jgi:hypothetical protein